MARVKIKVRRTVRVRTTVRRQLVRRVVVQPIRLRTAGVSAEPDYVPEHDQAICDAEGEGDE